LYTNFEILEYIFNILKYNFEKLPVDGNCRRIPENGGRTFLSKMKNGEVDVENRRVVLYSPLLSNTYKRSDSRHFKIVHNMFTKIVIHGCIVSFKFKSKRRNSMLSDGQITKH